jgi:hypothetical protein
MRSEGGNFLCCGGDGTENRELRFSNNLTLTFHIELLHFSNTFHSFSCVWFSSKNLFSLHSKSTLDEFNLHFNCMHGREEFCELFTTRNKRKYWWFVVGWLSSDTTESPDGFARLRTTETAITYDEMRNQERIEMLFWWNIDKEVNFVMRFLCFLLGFREVFLLNL